MRQATAPYRAGFMLPSSNTVFEDRCFDVLSGDPRIRAHFARVQVVSLSEKESSLGQFAQDRMLTAARSLAEARPDCIVWAGTAASWLGFEVDEALCRDIEATWKVRALSTALAVNARLSALKVRSLGLVTPYCAGLEARIIKNYEALGIRVVGAERLDLTENTDYAAVHPSRVREMVLNVAQKGPDAVVVMCTNLAGARIAQEAEREIGRPVLDSVDETLNAVRRAAL